MPPSGHRCPADSDTTRPARRSSSQGRPRPARPARSARSARPTHRDAPHPQSSPARPRPCLRPCPPPNRPSRPGRAPRPPPPPLRAAAGRAGRLRRGRRRAGRARNRPPPGWPAGRVRRGPGRSGWGPGGGTCICPARKEFVMQICSGLLRFFPGYYGSGFFRSIPEYSGKTVFCDYLSS